MHHGDHFFGERTDQDVILKHTVAHVTFEIYWFWLLEYLAQSTLPSSRIDDDAHGTLSHGVPLCSQGSTFLAGGMENTATMTTPNMQPHPDNEHFEGNSRNDGACGKPCTQTQCGLCPSLSFRR